ncbi:MAG: phage major capsid protein [Pirellulales bacterium]
MIKLNSDARFRGLSEQALLRQAVGQRLTAEHQAALKHDRVKLPEYVNDRNSFSFELGLYAAVEHAKFRAALSSLDGSQGGYLTPSEEVLPMIEQALDLYAPIRGVATVKRIKMGLDSGQALIDDAGAEGYMDRENTATTATELDFKLFKFRPHVFTSGVLAVPHAMIEDGVDSLSGQIGEALARRVARRQNRHWTSELVAVAPAVTDGVGSSAVDYDDLVSVIDAVGAAYRSSPSFGIMMHPDTLTKLWQGKDGSGAPILHLMRDFGVKFILNARLDATIQSGAISMVAGDFAQLVVLDDAAMQIQTFHERGAEQDQILFQARLKSGVAVLNTSGEPAFAAIHH